MNIANRHANIHIVGGKGRLLPQNHKYNVIQLIYGIIRNKNDFIFIVKKTRYLQSEAKDGSSGGLK
jgi:hypothetical protein